MSPPPLETFDFLATVCQNTLWERLGALLGAAGHFLDLIGRLRALLGLILSSVAPWAPYKSMKTQQFFNIFTGPSLAASENLQQLSWRPLEPPGAHLEPLGPQKELPGAHMEPFGASGS